MKRLLSLSLALAMVFTLMSAFSLISNAAGVFVIPKLEIAPTIDGKISNGEWATGGKCTLTPENAKFTSAKVDASGDFYWCWADDGLYILAVVKDATIATTKYSAGAALNCTDGIQLELDPLNTKSNGYSKSYIFDFVPQSQAGGAIWFEHFRWASGTTADILEVAAEMTDDGYVIEVHLKWDALKKLNEDFAVAEGTKMGFGNILMDIDANHNALIADYSEICNAAKFNTLVLGAVAEPDLAGEGGGSKNVGVSLDDYRFSKGALTETDKGLLLTNPNKANSAVYAALKEPVELDGLTFTITPTMWSTGHWLSFCLSDKGDFTPGATNVAGFGNGLMVICQYVNATDYLCIIPYSINEKGFAVEGADLAVIASEYMFSTEPITISIKKDATLGYVIYVNGKKLVVADGGADIDLNFLDKYFTDGKAYLGFDMRDSNGSDRDPDTILIEKISVSDGAEEPSHDFSDWAETLAPTCTEKGSETRVCANCGAPETREIPALGHTAGETVIENSVASTCSEIGNYDEVVYCSVCHVEISRRTVIVPTNGHTFGEWITMKEPTLTEKGAEMRICLECGHAENRYLDVLSPAPLAAPDLTGDGLLTDSDVLYLLYHVFFPEDYPLTQDCDFTGDGDITDSDVIYLLYHVYFPEDYPIA